MTVLRKGPRPVWRGFVYELSRRETVVLVSVSLTTYVFVLTVGESFKSKFVKRGTVVTVSNRSLGTEETVQ